MNFRDAAGRTPIALFCKKGAISHAHCRKEKFCFSLQKVRFISGPWKIIEAAKFATLGTFSVNGRQDQEKLPEAIGRAEQTVHMCIVSPTAAIFLEVSKRTAQREREKERRGYLITANLFR